MKDDLISRQKAIDSFDGVKVDEEDCTEYDIGYNDGIDFAVSRLSVLPSAQPAAPRFLGTYELLSMLHKAAAISLIGPVKRYGKVCTYQIMDAEEYEGICYVDIYEETGDILRIEVPGINCEEDFKL